MVFFTIVRGEKSTSYSSIEKVRFSEPETCCYKFADDVGDIVVWAF